MLGVCALLLPGGLRAAEDTGAAASASVAADGKASAVESSVVRVFATVRNPDPYKPWSKQSPTEFAGSGVVIKGKRILTCAHVVLYASQVQVQANQSGDKLSGTVEALAPGIDLAVIKLDDESFFDTHPPLPFSKTLPEIKDSVLAYGFPQGGTSLSITKGIVSRIEFALYNYPIAGLRIQIDAAINPGNSGGPAVTGDKLIGLAFSHLGNAQNIGYIIPCEEIELFLEGIAHGHYAGKPTLFVDCQGLENSALRSFLKLDRSVQGAVVHKIDAEDAAGGLQQWDVITQIGDSALDDQGMIKLDPNLRVFFKYQVQKTARNGKVPLTVVRGGKRVTVEAPVASSRPLVIPSLRADGSYPSYFVAGPLVFSTATMEFIDGFARGRLGGNVIGFFGVVGSPLVKRLGDRPAFEGEQLVVVSSPFFPHKLTKGYGNPAYQVVKAVNGIPTKSLGHLVSYLRDCHDEFVVIEFDNRGGESLVFPRAEVINATEEVLTDNGLRSQASPDMLAIWNGKSGAAKSKP